MISVVVFPQKSLKASEALYTGFAGPLFSTNSNFIRSI
jgi:hypothetical protein